MPDIHDLRRAGLSLRQADYWTRRGWLRPYNPDCGTGHGRIWPHTEVRVAAAMSRLIAAGLTVEAAHTVARGQAELAPGITVTVTDLGVAA